MFFASLPEYQRKKDIRGGFYIVVFRKDPLVTKPGVGQWKPEKEHVEIEEVVEWMPQCTEECPTLEELRSWRTEGKRKEKIDDETTFCRSLSHSASFFGK